MHDALFYEYPLNEHFRVCLRLEAVFAQAEYFLDKQGYWNTRAAVASLCDLMTILDRPEFKGKLLLQLAQYKELFTSHLNDDSVNQAKLDVLLQKIETSSQFLQSSVGKLAQELDKVDFLTSVRLRLAQTGGGCNFDLPMYHFWLHKSAEQQTADLKKWFDCLQRVKEIITLLISISRRSSRFNEAQINNGFYEQSLDQNVEYQLLRLHIPAHLNAFPDISLGRHRFSFHLFALDENEKPHRVTDMVEFKLACCL